MVLFGIADSVGGVLTVRTKESALLSTPSDTLTVIVAKPDWPAAGVTAGYLECYLFAESATLRKQAVQTDEVANAVLFLLSPRSAGINAGSLVVDAGMSVNYFDEGIVKRATRVEEPR